MGKDLEIERFRKLLGELAEQNDAESTAPSGPFAPLSSALENRLFQVGIAKLAPPPPWPKRLWGWLRTKAVYRLLLPAVLVPTTAAAFLVPWLIRNLQPQLRYASAPVMERKLRAGRTLTDRSADDHTFLGESSAEVRERGELRIKRREMLTVMLPAVSEEKGAVAVSAFLRRSGVLQSWDVHPELQPDGSFLLLMPVRMLPDLKADQELLFAYGRREALPSIEELRAGKVSTDQRWRLQSLHLIVED